MNNPFLVFVLAVLRVGLPLPTWGDAVAVTAWLQAISGPLGQLIADLVDGLNKGTLEIELLDGERVFLHRTVDGKVVASQIGMDLLAESLAKSVGAAPEGDIVAKDGRWLALLEKLLPLILQILPLLLTPEPKADAMD